MSEEELEDYMKQIDMNKVRIGINAIEYLGCGSLMKFTNRINTNNNNHYIVDINISKKHSEWEFIATYNGVFMREITLALRSLADIILKAV